MRFVVGSTSEHKIRAVRRALAFLGIEASVSGVATASHVNEQPLGLRETRLGAWHRAKGAADSAPDAWAVGIESGLFGAGGDGPIDVAVLILRSPAGLEWIGLSSGTPFEPVDVDTARQRGFGTTTAGSVMAERTGCDKTDGTSWLTGGRVSREDTLVDGLRVLFAVALSAKAGAS